MSKLSDEWAAAVETERLEAENKMSELPTDAIYDVIQLNTLMASDRMRALSQLSALIEYNHRLRVDFLELQDTIDGDGFVIDNQRAIIDNQRAIIARLELRNIN